MGTVGEKMGGKNGKDGNGEQQLGGNGMRVGEKIEDRGRKAGFVNVNKISIQKTFSSVPTRITSPLTQYPRKLSTDLSAAGTSLTIVAGAKKQNFCGEEGGHPPPTGNHKNESICS